MAHHIRPSSFNNSTTDLNSIGPDGTTEPTTFKPKTCEICAKEGPEAFWFDSTNLFVHAKCVRQIQDLDNILLKAIDALFSNKMDPLRQEAHAAAIKAIKEKIGSQTLISYLKTNGLEKTSCLFQVNGVLAINQTSMKSKL